MDNEKGQTPGSRSSSSPEKETGSSQEQSGSPEAQQEHLEQTLAETQRRMDETFRRLQEQTEGTGQFVQKWVRQNPVVSALGAAGIGLLMGRALSSSRKAKVDASMSVADRIEVRAREIARQRAKEGRKTPEDRLKTARTKAQAAGQTVRKEGEKRLKETKSAVSKKMTGVLGKAALALLARKVKKWMKDKPRRG